MTTIVSLSAGCVFRGLLSYCDPAVPHALPWLASCGRCLMNDFSDLVPYKDAFC